MSSYSEQIYADFDKLLLTLILILMRSHHRIRIGSGLCLLILNKTITEFEMKSNNWCRNKNFKLSIDTVNVSVDDCKMIPLETVHYKL